MGSPRYNVSFLLVRFFVWCFFALFVAASNAQGNNAPEVCQFCSIHFISMSSRFWIQSVESVYIGNWSEGRETLIELSLCYSIVYHYSGTSSSYRSVDWIRLWSCLVSVSSVFWAPLYIQFSCYYVYLNFFVKFLVF